MFTLGLDLIVHSDSIERLFLREKILDMFVINLAVLVLDGNQVVCRELFGDVVDVETQRLIDLAREFVGVRGCWDRKNKGCSAKSGTGFRARFAA